jgi:hypothetical protein
MSDFDLCTIIFSCGLYLILLYFIRTNSADQNQLRYTQVKQKMILKVEEIPNHVYLWNDNTEDFVAQGKDMDEAISKAKKRFPNITFYIKEYEIKN